MWNQLGLLKKISKFIIIKKDIKITSKVLRIILNPIENTNTALIRKYIIDISFLPRIKIREQNKEQKLSELVFGRLQLQVVHFLFGI